MRCKLCVEEGITSKTAWRRKEDRIIGDYEEKVRREEEKEKREVRACEPRKGDEMRNATQMPLLTPMTIQPPIRLATLVAEGGRCSTLHQKCHPCPKPQERNSALGGQPQQQEGDSPGHS